MKKNFLVDSKSNVEGRKLCYHSFSDRHCLSFIGDFTLVMPTWFVINFFHLKLSSSRKYPYSPHRRDWKFLGVGGSQKPKNLKKCKRLNWNFRRGGGLLWKIPSVWEVWIFYGIAHYRFPTPRKHRSLIKLCKLYRMKTHLLLQYLKIF